MHNNPLYPYVNTTLEISVLAVFVQFDLGLSIVHHYCEGGYLSKKVRTTSCTGDACMFSARIFRLYETDLMTVKRGDTKRDEP